MRRAPSRRSPAQAVSWRRSCAGEATDAPRQLGLRFLRRHEHAATTLDERNQCRKQGSCVVARQVWPYDRRQRDREETQDRSHEDGLRVERSHRPIRAQSRREGEEEQRDEDGGGYETQLERNPDVAVVDVERLPLSTVFVRVRVVERAVELNARAETDARQRMVANALRRLLPLLDPVLRGIVVSEVRERRDALLAGGERVVVVRWRDRACSGSKDDAGADERTECHHDPPPDLAWSQNHARRAGDCGSEPRPSRERQQDGGEAESRESHADGSQPPST